MFPRPRSIIKFSDSARNRNPEEYKGTVFYRTFVLLAPFYNSGTRCTPNPAIGCLILWKTTIYGNPHIMSVNYDISLTWIKANRGWFPLLTMIPVRSQWGRYSLPRYNPIARKNKEAKFLVPNILVLVPELDSPLASKIPQEIYIHHLLSVLVFSGNLNVQNSSK